MQDRLYGKPCLRKYTVPVGLRVGLVNGNAEETRALTGICNALGCIDFRVLPGDEPVTRRAPSWSPRVVVMGKTALSGSRPAPSMGMPPATESCRARNADGVPAPAAAQSWIPYPMNCTAFLESLSSVLPPGS